MSRPKRTAVRQNIKRPAIFARLEKIYVLDDSARFIYVIMLWIRVSLNLSVAAARIRAAKNAYFGKKRPGGRL